MALRESRTDSALREGAAQIDASAPLATGHGMKFPQGRTVRSTTPLPSAIVLKRATVDVAIIGAGAAGIAAARALHDGGCVLGMDVGLHWEPCLALCAESEIADEYTRFGS